MDDENKRTTIVIAADSLSMPRPFDQGDIGYEDTYSYLLKRSLGEAWKNVDVLVHGRRSNNIKFLDQKQNFYDEITAWEPKVVILHIGICDCAPRIFSIFEKKIVDRIRPIALRDHFIQFVGQHRRFIISHRPLKVDVPIKEFERSYKHVVDGLLEKGIIILAINICPTNTETAYRSPGLSENIVKYNRIIENSVNREGCYLIDLHKVILGLGPDDYLLDGIHLNKAGNKVLADLIVSTLLNIQALNNGNLVKLHQDLAHF